MIFLDFKYNEKAECWKIPDIYKPGTVYEKC